MTIPKQDTREIYKDDLINQERNPDTVDLKCYEPSPFNKTLFIITPRENGILKKISYSFGPDDSSLNGYVIISISRIQNVNMFVTSQAQNQVIWSQLLTGGGKGVEEFDQEVYLYRGEPLYIQGVTNYPAPAKIIGHLLLSVMPTYR